MMDRIRSIALAVTLFLFLHETLGQGEKISFINSSITFSSHLLVKACLVLIVLPSNVDGASSLRVVRGVRNTSCEYMEGLPTNCMCLTTEEACLAFPRENTVLGPLDVVGVVSNGCLEPKKDQFSARSLAHRLGSEATVSDWRLGRWNCRCCVVGRWRRLCSLAS
jgi:hypothetical protein